MIIDGPVPADAPPFDVCIIGGGIAGISLALRLSRTRQLSVGLLESGGLTFDEANQDLARAATEGFPYYALHETRIRALGGSSWSWGGVCTRLDRSALEERDWVPGGGWPIGAEDLDPYLDDALGICGISEEDRARVDGEAERAFAEAGLDPERVAPVSVYFGRPRRFGVAFRTALERAPVRVHLGSTVTRLVTDGDNVVGVEGMWRRRSAFSIAARTVVLASGGVENARLLMVAGLGSEATGRYFMEHPRVVDRYRIRRGDTPLSRFVGGGASGTLRFRRLATADRLQRDERLLGYHANLQIGYRGQEGEQWAAVRRLAIATRTPWKESPYYQDAGGGRVGVRRADILTVLRRPHRSLFGAMGALTEHPSLRRTLEVWSALEQIPDPANRIELGDETDALGMPCIRLKWSVGPDEERSYRRSLATLLDQLERLEPGISAARVDEPDAWPAQIKGNWHHEGTTRMHDDRRLGVVDRDCRVHGLTNLYAAGSSVFTTSGSTSPSVTIIQLALRLGDHLSAALASRPEEVSGSVPVAAV